MDMVLSFLVSAGIIAFGVWVVAGTIIAGWPWPWPEYGRPPAGSRLSAAASSGIRRRRAGLRASGPAGAAADVAAPGRHHCVRQLPERGPRGSEVLRLVRQSDVAAMLELQRGDGRDVQILRRVRNSGELGAWIGHRLNTSISGPHTLLRRAAGSTTICYELLLAATSACTLSIFPMCLNGHRVRKACPNGSDRVPVVQGSERARADQLQHLRCAT